MERQRALAILFLHEHVDRRLVRRDGDEDPAADAERGIVVVRLLGHRVERQGVPADGCQLHVVYSVGRVRSWMWRQGAPRRILASPASRSPGAACELPTATRQSAD
jgi:hypothetical protein